MVDGSMRDILERLRRLGPDWHKKLADEMTGEDRARIVEAIESSSPFIEPFVLIVTDRDKLTFSVEGPMVNDIPWDKVVVAAQQQGRYVNCHVPGEPARSDVETAAQLYAQEYPDMQRVPAGSIVRLGLA